MKIGSVETDNDVFVIAEIGNNHEGSFSRAEEMIARAAQAGADAVKFQSIIPEKLASYKDKDRLAQLRRFRLNAEEMVELKAVADREGVLFLCTPFSLESVAFLNDLVPAFKVASGDNDFYPLLEAIARTAKPILLSTGMAGLPEIKKTIEFIRKTWSHQEILPPPLAILHCVVSYPTPQKEANLLAIRTLQTLGLTVGYSDHTLGIEAAVLASALGARIIEKHFTLDKTHSTFRDHQLSADPAEFKELVDRIKEAQILLGDGTKRIMDSERPSLSRVRRTIVAARDLKIGDVITWKDLNWVRLGCGLAPGCEELLIGKKVRIAIEEGEAILVDSLADQGRA